MANPHPVTKGRISKNKPEEKSFRNGVKRTFLKLGDDWLLQFAKDHPAEFFRGMISLEPKEITGKDGGPIETISTVVIGGQK